MIKFVVNILMIIMVVGISGCSSEEDYDDFINNYSAYLIKDSIDYSGITDLNAGKLFVSTRLLSSEYENLKAGEYEITNKQFYNLRCIISIKEEPKEENLKEIYSVYEQWRNLRLDFEIDTGKFWVSFGGDLAKNKMFVNNHMPMVGYQEWSTYDETITHYIKVVDDSLSYEEFCSELKENDINRN